MPIPKPHKEEKHDKFISRCMSDPVMVKEYKDIKQRYAICNSQISKSELEAGFRVLLGKEESDNDNNKSDRPS